MRAVTNQSLYNLGVGQTCEARYSMHETNSRVAIVPSQ